jgi:hypothetical protein
MQPSGFAKGGRDPPSQRAAEQLEGALHAGESVACNLLGLQRDAG